MMPIIFFIILFFILFFLCIVAAIIVATKSLRHYDDVLNKYKEWYEENSKDDKEE